MTTFSDTFDAVAAPLHVDHFGESVTYRTLLNGSYVESIITAMVGDEEAVDTSQQEG